MDNISFIYFIRNWNKILYNADISAEINVSYMCDT